MIQTDEEITEERFPGLPLAYELVPESYRIPERRLDVIEGRLGALATVIATVTVAVPTLLRGTLPTEAFGDWRFLAALAVALASVACALWARNRGVLSVLDLPTIQAHYVVVDPGEFRQSLLYYAAEHFKKNMARVQKKARWLDVLTVGFLVQVALLTAWISSQ